MATVQANIDDTLPLLPGFTEPAPRRPIRRSVSIFRPLISDAEKDRDEVVTPELRPFLRAESVRGAVTSLFSTTTSPTLTPRQTSYINQGSSLTYVSNASNGPSLGSHIHDRGLIEGRHSDITVIAFGTRYALHRLILDRAPFFASALSPPWLEASSKEIVIRPEDTDQNISRRTFELALRRLYGCHDQVEEEPEKFGLLATGCWLEMQDLIDDSVDAILQSLHSGSLIQAIHMMTANCYGKAGDKVLTAANLILAREGTQLPMRFWDSIPADNIREVIGDDSFFARSEFDRWTLAKDILNARLRMVAETLDISVDKKAPRNIRRFQGRLSSAMDEDSDDDDIAKYETWLKLYTHTEIVPLLHLLDNGIYYVHLDFDQLSRIKSTSDIFGLPTVPDKVLTGALWLGLDLRHKVLNSRGRDELRLAKTSGRNVQVTFLNSSPKAEGEDRRKKMDGSKFWIPWQDCNIVFGANKSYSPFALPERKQLQYAPSSGEASLRDLMMSAQNEEEQRTMSFTRIPPYRFAAEFPRPQSLKDRRRVYSENFFYAGSYWNIYIQKLLPGRVNKKSRLGFYLHRVKDTSEELIGSVDERIHALEQGILLRSDPPRDYGTADSRLYADTSSDAEDTTHIHAAMQTLISRQSRADGPRPISHLQIDDSDSTEDRPPQLDLATFKPPGSPKKKPVVATLPPYIDSRPSVKAYFKIYCPSASGRFLTLYQSVPDNFNFSQSWGWKSSTLLCEDDWQVGDLVVPEDDDSGISRKLNRLELDRRAGDGSDVADAERERDDRNRESDEDVIGGDGKLRFMVVLGIV